MPDTRSDARCGALSVIPALLRMVRDELGLDVGLVCEVTDRRLSFHVVESRVPLPFAAGVSTRRSGSLPEQLLAGLIPALCPDVAALALASGRARATRIAIRSVVAMIVPVQGRMLVIGVAGLSARPDLTEQAARVLALAVEQMSGELATAATVWTTSECVSGVLADGGPMIAAQPIVDISSGQVVGVEALSRFADGRSPDRWFADAASVGLGVALELAAARRATLLLDRVRGTVAINLSASALADEQVVRFLAAQPVSRLVVELTEHEAVADYAALGAVLAPLRRRGMGLAVDDAGAGFASLRHVLQLAPDWIKIDQSIVRHADTDQARAVLLKALVVFARGSGVRVLAEGVETAGEAALVARLGVHCAQGWFFGRPNYCLEGADAGPSPAWAQAGRLAKLPRPRSGDGPVPVPLAG